MAGNVIVIEEPEVMSRESSAMPCHPNVTIFGANRSRKQSMRETHMPDSMIWLGRIVDANDVLAITATSDGRRRGSNKTSGNVSNEHVYSVVIDLAEDTVELRLNLGQLQGVQRLVERFRSSDLPGVLVSIDGQVSAASGRLAA